MPFIAIRNGVKFGWRRVIKMLFKKTLKKHQPCNLQRQGSQQTLPLTPNSIAVPLSFTSVAGLFENSRWKNDLQQTGERNHEMSNQEWKVS